MLFIVPSLAASSRIFRTRHNALFHKSRKKSEVSPLDSSTMAPTTSNRIFKNGRVCIVLAGRMAGKKAVVLSAYDQGNRQRSFGHALVVGIQRSPKKITRKMNAAKVDRRTNVKVFLKHINYCHLMPTRYVVAGEIDAKTLIGDKKIETHAEKTAVRTDIAKALKAKFCDPAAAAKSSKELVFLRKPLRF